LGRLCRPRIGPAIIDTGTGPRDAVRAHARRGAGAGPGLELVGLAMAFAAAST